DVTPDGKFLTVSGKLDPHVSIYASRKFRTPLLLAILNMMIMVCRLSTLTMLLKHKLKWV
ncbi:MAG: hypothetical protein M5U34_47965, partial [Chloroflexi bacterium]|nr:hypothetical protein [Chloroflexota bacterium]